MNDRCDYLARLGFTLVLVYAVNDTLRAQPAEVNYDESRVPTYELPDPLLSAGGQRVTDASTWRTTRRPEVLHLFETQMYGRWQFGRLRRRSCLRGGFTRFPGQIAFSKVVGN